jgi:hypothetical protein
LLQALRKPGKFALLDVIPNRLDPRANCINHLVQQFLPHPYSSLNYAILYPGEIMKHDKPEIEIQINPCKHDNHGHILHEIKKIEHRLENIEDLLQILVNFLSSPPKATKLFLSFAKPVQK